MKKITLILSILMASCICQAQYTNHQLYQAYLKRDMTIWQQYIASAKWEELNNEEQKQLLNYEYGFAAYVLSHDVMQNIMPIYQDYIATNYRWTNHTY